MRVAFLGLVLLASATLGAVLSGDLRLHPLVDAGLLAAALAGAVVVVRAGVTTPYVLGGLVAVRVVAWCGGPTLSDDQWRYVHEGRAQRLGLAVPYQTPPAALSPAPPPDDGASARVNHPDVAAAYPPGVELVLYGTVAAGDAIGHPLVALRALLAAADLFILVALFRRRREACLLYGAHPLPLLEVAMGGHLDGLGVCALFASLLLSRPLLQGALCGLAAHVKPIAAVGLLALPKRAFIGFGIAALLPAIPYLFARAPIFGGLLEYGTRWRSAPFLYAALEAPLSPFFAERAARNVYAFINVPGLRPILVDAGLCARVLAGAILGGALIAIARSKASLEKRVGFALAAVWLLAPAVHPWYLVWIVPFAALSASRALLAFTAAAPLLYQPVFAYASTGTWHEAVWPRVVVVAAFVGGAILDRRAR